MDMLILIGSFCVLCLLGMPVAYALGLAAIVAALWIDLPLEAVMLKTSDGMDDFALLAIPFFILAGGIMAEGGMATRIVNLAKVFVGFIRGGLALVNILASTFFGCISGSSVADTAAIGSVMIPQMIKAGYPRLFAVNVTIAGSLQPLLIPPSHNAVIYSLAAGGTISVAHLFIAGIIPGVMLGLSLMILCFYIARRDNFPKGEVIPLRQAIKIAGEAFWGLVTVAHHHRRHPQRHLHADRVRRGRLHLFVPGHDVHLSRLQMERAAAAGRARGAHRRHGDDHDRVLDRLRLHDGDHADPGEGDGVLRLDLQRQVHVPVPDQHPAAGARDLHGPRADAADLHADLPAGGEDVRHRSGAFRHDHDPQSRHRAADAAGRADAGGRLRDRQGHAWRRCRRAS